MNDSEIKMISCGTVFSLVYKNDGDLLVCGYNNIRQLGIMSGNRIIEMDNSQHISVEHENTYTNFINERFIDYKN